MSVQTRDFVDVAERAREFGCRVPVGIALLPGNFSTAADAGEFCFHAAAPHVRSAWQSVGLDDEGPEARDTTSSALPGGLPQDGTRVSCHKPALPDPVEAGSPVPGAQVPLAVFFGVRLMVGPAWCLAVALGMVSSVLASHPCCANPNEIRFDVVVERPSGGYACLEYRGDAYGLVALAKEVRGIWAGR
jgi:hypothetical protein